MEDLQEENLTPPEIIDKANEVSLNLLPKKSKVKYNLQYNQFMQWCASKKIKKYSENVILTYLSELSNKYKPSTLWSIHSMLKSTLLVKDNIDIGKYRKVTYFLKRQSVGHVAKKSRIFEQQEIENFLRLAPDEIYLLTKVVLIIGISGACRTEELTKMTIDDVVDKDDILIIHVPDTKTYKQRTFTVCNVKKKNCIDVVSICKKYFSMRPPNMNSRRLFVKYHAGKCAAQNVGHHTIGAMPSKIAAYLNLPNPKEYTGHAFRRTSATLLANSGADILALKRHGGWKSSSVAEGYVEDCLNNKIAVAKKLLDSGVRAASTSTENLCKVGSASTDTQLNTLPVADADDCHDQVLDKFNMSATSNEMPVVNETTPLISAEKSSTVTAFSEQLNLSNLSKQGTSFFNCTIMNPMFNINVTNNNNNN